MKKIMFYINVINGGGAARVMTNLATQFAKNDYQTIFVTSYNTDGEYLLNKNVKRYSLEEVKVEQSKLMRNLSRIKKLRNLCKNEKPDILISFMGEANLRAIIATMGLPTKTIISVRNDPRKEYAGKIMHFVGKCILPLASGCVFQTEDAKRWFPQKLQNKSTIIFNAVKSDFYDVTRNTRNGLIVTCGRLVKHKNQKMLINCIGRLREKYPILRLKIYGEGVWEEELRQQIKELHLEDKVTLEGLSDDVPKALAEADIFVLSSEYEGMPNALMEAMAVGIPCISTDCPCGGPEMLLKDGRGILVPVNEEEKMMKAIDKLLHDNELKEVYSTSCKVYAETFTAEKIFRQWEIYIDKILNI